MKLNVQGHLKFWLVAFGESTMKQNTSSIVWYNWFKEGRADVNDNASPGRPSTSTTDENIEAMKKIILDNHRSCQAIFMDI